MKEQKQHASRFGICLQQKDKTTSEDYIGEMQSNFLEGEPIIDFDYYYNFAKAIIPTITVDEVSALAKKHLNRKNMVIVDQGPSEGVKHLTERRSHRRVGQS